MDLPPPQPPSETSPVRALQGESVTGEIFAALLLLVVVGSIFAAGLLADRGVSGGEPAPSSRLDLRIQAQYEVGMRLLADNGDWTLDLAAMDVAARRLDGLARSPRERIALAPVYAHLEPDLEAGDELARELLSTFAEDLSLDAQIRAEASAFLRLYDLPPEAPPPDAREDLLATYGWFARLALDRLETGTPVALQRARGVAQLLSAAAVGLLLLLLGGIFAAAGLVQRVLDGRIGSRYLADTEGTTPHRLPYLEAALLFLVAITVLGVVAGLLARRGGNHELLLLNWLLLPVLLWPRLRGRSAEEVRLALGWHRGRGVLVEVGCGLLAYLAAMPLLAVGLVATLSVARWRAQSPHHPMVDWLAAADAGGILVVAVLAVIWAPLVEESLFRGGLYHYLRSRFGVLGSVLWLSVLFAAIHPQGVAGLPFLFSLAAALALVREWRGSILASITLHMVHNGFVTLVLIFLLS